MSLEGLSQTRQEMATGGSAFHARVDVSTPGKALAFLPIGVAYFLFSPFPWEITSVLKLFSLPEMILIYVLTPAAVRGIAHCARDRFRDCFQVLLLTGLLTVSYSLGEGNVGTLYRHRAMVITDPPAKPSERWWDAGRDPRQGSRCSSGLACPR